VLFVQQKCLFKITIKEEFEDTKGVIIILKSKDRQYNDQKKEKNEGQTTIYKHYKKIALRNKSLYHP
jgi:hypothetical protein